MKIKLLSVFLIVSTFLSATVFALAPVPNSTIWFSPAEARPGESININAFIYNDTSLDAQMTVTFKMAGKTIKTLSNFEVASKSAKVATSDYVMPKEPEALSIVVENAHSKNGEKLNSLNGTLEVKVIGGSETVIVPEEIKIKGFFGSVLTELEEFRVEQLSYFSALHQSSKDTLVNKAIKDIGDVFTSSDSANNNDGSNTVLNRAGDYLKYLYATATKFLFGSKIVYYGVIIIFVLFLFRMIFSRLF